MWEPVIQTTFDLINGNLIIEDISDYAGNGYSGFNGILKISDPFGVVIHENSGYDSNVFTSPDVSNIDRDVSFTLPIDTTTTEAVLGDYVIQYKFQGMIGASEASPLSISEVFSYEEQELPIVCIDVDVDCDGTILTSTDSTSYGATSPTVARTHTINYPAALGLSPVVTTSQSQQITPIYTQTWSTSIESDVTYTIGINQFVLVHVEGYKEFTVDCTNSLCGVYECINAITSKHETLLRTNPIDAGIYYSSDVQPAHILALMYMYAWDCGKKVDAANYLADLKGIAGITTSCGCGGSCGDDCSCSGDSTDMPKQVVGKYTATVGGGSSLTINSQAASAIVDTESISWSQASTTFAARIKEKSIYTVGDISISGTTHQNAIVKVNPTAADARFVLPAISSVYDGFSVGLWHVGGGNDVLLELSGSDTIETGTYGIDETLTSGSYPISQEGTLYVFSANTSSSQWRVLRKYKPTAGGVGDVTAAAVIGDNSIVRGNGGAKGVQESPVTIDDSGNITGANNITVSGTVDGVDLAAEAAKLSGIEAGATADQSGAEIVALFGAESDANVLTDVMAAEIAANTAKVSADGLVGTHSDIDETVTASEGDALTWNSTTSKYEPRVIPGGGGGGTGDVTASANMADNSISRGDGGAKGVQDSLVTIDDSGNVSGIVNLTVTGNISLGPTGTVDGADISAESTKLAGIEAGATADQTGTEMVSAINAVSDSNIMTDAEQAKLANISVTQAVDLDTMESDIAAKVSADGSINTHSDVNTSGLSDGDILVYDTGSGDWEAQAFSGITSTESTSNTLTFSSNHTYHRATSDVGLTGDLTVTLSSGRGGNTITIKHNDSSVPTFTGAAIEWQTDLAASYQTGSDNYIFLQQEDGAGTPYLFGSIKAVGSSGSGYTTGTSTSNTISLANNYTQHVGASDAALTGDLILSLTDTNGGNVAVVKHNDTSVPNISGATVVQLRSLASNYVLGSDNYIHLTQRDVSGGSPQVLMWIAENATNSYKSLVFDADDFTEAATNGATKETISAGNNTYKVLSFSVGERAIIKTSMPSDYAGGSVKFRAKWETNGGTAGDKVGWVFQGVCTKDEIDLDSAQGTSQIVYDTVTVAGKQKVAGASTAVTVSNTPSAGDAVFFEISMGSLSQSDARLHGIEMQYPLQIEPTGLWSSSSDSEPVASGFLMDGISGTQTAYYDLNFQRITGATKAFRIRRDSDDAELDIGFSSGLVDEAAITTFLGNTIDAGPVIAYLTEITDQGGDGTWDQLQATDANQAPLVKRNGFISARLTGNTGTYALRKMSTAAATVVAAPNYHFVTVEEENPGHQIQMFDSHSSATNFQRQKTLTSSIHEVNNGTQLYTSVGGYLTTRSVMTYKCDTSGYMRKDGVEEIAGDTGNNGMGGHQLWVVKAGNTNHFAGYWFGELIQSGSLSDTDRDAIETQLTTDY